MKLEGDLTDLDKKKLLLLEAEESQAIVAATIYQLNM